MTGGKNNARVLLVNPYIHDFAAYDVWSKPYGLLLLGAILRDHGVTVDFYDCLDRFHPKSPQTDPQKRCGRGPYLKTVIPTPEGLSDVNRRFCRYGVKPDWFLEDIKALPKPDLILVTSIMTYWASGVAETIKLLKSVFPTVPIVLGGIYATLCYEHAAQDSGADEVISGPGEPRLFSLIQKYTGHTISPLYDVADLDQLPIPAYDLQRKINHAAIQTSRGCPFSCSYCASNKLDPRFRRKNPVKVIEEICYWHTHHGVIDFAFYDDALLVGWKRHAGIIFQGVIDAGINVRFHTPNAIHVREINETTADLMFRAGFETLRLGVETIDFENRVHLDTKITETDFERAVRCLKEAGFKASQIGAYLLCGLPDQSPHAVEKSVLSALSCGITPVLTHYTPIPHTAMWDDAVKTSRYDLTAHPVFTNNAIFPCSGTFTWNHVARLKKLIAQKRESA